MQVRENQQRGPTERIQAGDEVLCRRFQLTRLEGKKKQELLYEGLFKVTHMVKDSVAELEGLPIGAPSFINVQYLRRYYQDDETEPLRARDVPEKPVEDAGGTEWEVEEIKDVRQSRGRKEYLLKWKGYSRLTWVASKDLTYYKELLADFQKRQRGNNPCMRRQA